MALAIGIVAFVFMDLIVVTTLIRSLVAPLQELAKQFPAREPAAQAVRREFQSFRFGMMDAGWGIHVAVDDQHLHLSPARLERMFRVPAMSVPWAHVKLVKRGERRTKVRVEGEKEKVEIIGPTWCLELAS